MNQYLERVMKTKILSLIILALALSSCGKDNKLPAVVGPIQSDPNAFTTGVLANGGLPQSKDSISFNHKKYFNSNGVNCSYIIKTDVLVTRATESFIRFKIKNETTRSERNSSYCPYTPSNMRGIQIKSMSTEQYIAEVTKKINASLNPSVYCSENSNWCASSTLIDKKEVTKYGIPAIYIEAEFQNKNGHAYVRKSYISTNSLLENVFEFEMTNTRTGERVDFKTLRPGPRRRRDQRN
ncbi:MAG: hypothetical protein ACJAT2_000525 [Bacteriovoracaceae bacterium]|jgi:hypothetical protein